MKLITKINFRYLKIVTTGTLILGIYCHLSRLVFGMDNLLRYLLTPFFEGFFALPMIIGAILQLAFIKHINYRNLAEKIVYGICSFQFIASIPLHIYASMMRDSSYANFFSPYYSVFSILMWTYFIYVIAGLKIKSTAVHAIL